MPALLRDAGMAHDIAVHHSATTSSPFITIQ